MVDDDRSMVGTLCVILGMHGWRTSGGYDGEAAADLAEAGEVDVVLMDVIMPRMNGVDAMRAIISRRPDTRVILMTAYAPHDLIAKAEQQGVFRVLAKPVQLPNLLSLLDEAVP